MLPLVVAVLIVTFYGAGTPAAVKTQAVSDQAACEALKAEVVKALDANDKVSGYSFTCVPAQVKLPAGKV